MRFSVLPARAIDDARLSRTHLRCLAALCTYTDQNGWAWPSTSTIADKLGVSRQLVSRCLHDLKAWGFVEIRAQRGDDGGQTSNLYRVLFDVGEPVAPPATSGVAPPATSDVAAPATSRGCTNAPVNVPLNAAAARAPARTAVDASAHQEQEKRQKRRIVRASGIVTWTPDDHPEAGRIEQRHGVDAIGAAVAALAAAGKEPVPGLVAREIDRQRRAHEAAERQAATEAAQAASPFLVDPASLQHGDELMAKIRRSRTCKPEA